MHYITLHKFDASTETMGLRGRMEGVGPDGRQLQTGSCTQDQSLLHACPATASSAMWARLGISFAVVDVHAAAAFLAGDYSDKGEEIQISHYRL